MVSHQLVRRISHTMSHQGYEGWFPECIVCNMGNVSGAICLDSTCHEMFYADSLEAPRVSEGDFLFRDNHHWKKCCCCDHLMLSDPGAWGSYCICISCFTVYFRARRLPPNSPGLVHLDLVAGILRHPDDIWVVEPGSDR